MGTVVGTFTINGFNGELRGRVQLADGMVIAYANDGSQLATFDVTGSCAIDEAEGCVRCTTPMGSFRSDDPVWVRWSQEAAEITASSHDDRSYRVDHRQSSSSDSSGLLPAHGRRQQSSSDSSGLLPARGRRQQSSSYSSGILQAMPHRLGLSGFGDLLSRWKPWQLVVAAGVALLLLLIAVVLFGLLVVWGVGLIRSHGGEWFKHLPIPVELESSQP
jgi:hypothetical protein